MTPLYEWEKTLVKERYFEPLEKGYYIDNLLKSDRQMLAGMLYTLHYVIENWIDAEKAENRKRGGVMGMLADEYVIPAADRLEERFMKAIRLFVEDTLDGYEWEQYEKAYAEEKRKEAKEKSAESAATDSAPKRD